MQIAQRADAGARGPEAERQADGRGAGFWIAAAAVLAAASYVAARTVALGPAPGPWAFWPINGILMGIFCRRPRREWPWIGLAAAAAQTAAIALLRGDVAGGATPLGALSDVVQAMLGAWAVCRLASPEGPLARPRDLAWFVVLAVCAFPLAVTPLSGLLLAWGLHLPFGTTWRPLFVGNSLGILLFAPLFVWRPREGAGVLPGWGSRAAEIAVCQAAILLLTVGVFRGTAGWLTYVAPYALFPLLAWSAVRCGPRWTSASMVAAAAVASWCTARGTGPFAPNGGGPDAHVLQLQVFLAFAAFTALLLSAFTEHGRQAFGELALQASVQRAFLESSSAALVLKDLHGRVVLSNRRAEELAGGSQDYVLDRRVGDSPSPPWTDSAEQDRRVLERGEAMVFEERVLVGGQERTFSVTRVPVRDHTGQVRYLGVVARDETLERELAARLKNAQRVEILGQLAAGLAHDLNNLLTVIVGNVEMLRTGPAAVGEDGELLEEVREAGARAARLTGRLLLLGRSRAAPRVPVALDDLLRGLEPMLRVLARGGADLAVAPGAPEGCVLADPLEMEQVVLNLVANARDAVAGGGRIELSTRTVRRDEVSPGAAQASPAERWVRLTVADTGTGMDEATLARLFEPFFTTKEDGKGTGLGLYTTSLLVRQMGGAVHATSTPGQGTEFVVELPCA